MKNLVLGSLIALAATQAAGCVITSDDDAFVSATWTFTNISTNTTTSCPPGYDTVRLYNQEVTSSGTFIGSPIPDTFDCDVGGGTSAPLPPSLYLSWIEVTSHNNAADIYAQSTSAYVDVTVSDKTFNAEILNDGGYFELAWNLYGATTNQDLSCAQAGSTGVESVVTEVNNGANSVTDPFPCEDIHGITSGVRAGQYTLSVQALGANDFVISETDEILNKIVMTHNRVTTLGTIEIPITGK